jgi:Mor family transcriptional regulator
MNARDQTEMFDPTDADAVDLIAHLGNQPQQTHQWPELLADLFSVHEAYNLRQGMSAEKAALDARDRCLIEAQYIGARMVYFPTGEKLKTALRDALIYREFNGHNHLALAQKYKLTVTRVYQIVAEQTALFVKERQGKLFNKQGEGG